MGRPRGVPRVHVLRRSADRATAWPCPTPALRALGARAGSRSTPSRFRVRLVHYPSRDGTARLDVPRRRARPPDGRPRGRAAHRLRRLQRQPHPGLRPRPDPLPRDGRPLRRGPPARRRRIRRGLAPRGHARPEAERVRRLPRRRRLPRPARGTRRRGRLAIMGGSNGGLLVGAALTQRPDLFRAVVCQVPLLDMVRYHLFRIARLWIPEYGSAGRPRGLPVAPTPTRRTTTSATARPIRPSSSPPASRTAASIRCTRARWRRGCRPRPPPAIRSCCASRRGPATDRASRSPRSSRSGPTSGRSCSPSWASKPDPDADRPGAQRRCINIGRDGTPPRPAAPGRCSRSSLRRRAPAPGPPAGDAAADAARRGRARATTSPSSTISRGRRAWASTFARARPWRRARRATCPSTSRAARASPRSIASSARSRSPRGSSTWRRLTLSAGPGDSVRLTALLHFPYRPAAHAPAPAPGGAAHAPERGDAAGGRPVPARSGPGPLEVGRGGEPAPYPAQPAAVPRRAGRDRARPAGRPQGRHRSATSSSSAASPSAKGPCARWSCGWSAASSAWPRS